MNLKESFDFIDYFVICEFDKTITGEKREFLFEKYVQDIPEELINKIQYHKINCGDLIKETNSDDGKLMLQNEAYMQSWFSNIIGLKPNDIVVAADADEVIFRHMYPIAFMFLRKYQSIVLPLHQFFYRMNYLWENEIFRAPVICRSAFFQKKTKPIRWRYDGFLFPFMAGCHFSWQLTVEQMIYKLNAYAHKDLYGHLAKSEILEEAIREKTYPFEPERKFSIKELDPDIDRLYYPDSFYLYRDDFAHLLPEGKT